MVFKGNGLLNQIYLQVKVFFRNWESALPSYQKIPQTRPNEGTSVRSGIAFTPPFRHRSFHVSRAFFSLRSVVAFLFSDFASFFRRRFQLTVYFQRSPGKEPFFVCVRIFVTKTITSHNILQRFVSNCNNWKTLKF